LGFAFEYPQLEKTRRAEASVRASWSFSVGLVPAATHAKGTPRKKGLVGG
jgi:hypothetical protein